MKARMYILRLERAWYVVCHAIENKMFRSDKVAESSRPGGPHARLAVLNATVSPYVVRRSDDEVWHRQARFANPI